MIPEFWPEDRVPLLWAASGRRSGKWVEEGSSHLGICLLVLFSYGLQAPGDLSLLSWSSNMTLSRSRLEDQ